MTDDEREHVRLLTAFLFPSDDGRVRARFVLPSSRPSPRAELPALPATGKIVSIVEESQAPTQADLAAAELRGRAADERLRVAARQFRRPGGGIDFA